MQVYTKVLIISNLEIDAHVRNNLCYLICSRHFIRLESSHKSDFFLRENHFLYACATFLSYHLIKLPLVYTLQTFSRVATGIYDIKGT